MSLESEQEERRFLHDLANPVATAIFILEGVAEELAEVPASPENASLQQQVAAASAALDRAREFLTHRREILIQRGRP